MKTKLEQRRSILMSKLQQSHTLVTIKIQLDPTELPVERDVLMRKELPLRDLLRQAIRKFAKPGMLESDYSLYNEETRQPVDLQKPLYTLDLSGSLALLHRSRAQDADIVAYAPTPRYLIELHEERTGKTLQVEQLPAIVGRQKTDTTPDIDLGQFEFGRTVSGKHARLSRDENYLFIENLTEDNRLLVENENGVQVVRYMQPQVIENGNTIHIGKVVLRLNVRT